MTRFLSRASIQTQIGLALGAIGLVVCGSLVAAMMSAQITQDAFDDVSSRRLPAIFASFEAKESTVALQADFERLLASQNEATLAQADSQTQARRERIAKDGAQFADPAQEARLAEILAEFDAAREGARAATADRIAATTAKTALWATMQGLHERLTGALVTRVDEATFELTLQAETAKERLAESVSTLTSDDVETLMLLVRLQAAISEAEGVVIGLRAAPDAATRAALYDRLTSTRDRLSQLLASAPDALQDVIAGMKGISDLLALAGDPEKTSEYAAAGGADAVLAAKREAFKMLADRGDEANFTLVLGADELSASTGEQVDALSNAMTGEFRLLLDASGQTHLALGRVAQAFNAADADALTVLQNGTGSLVQKLQEFGEAAELSAFHEDLSTLVGVLSGEAGAFALRGNQLEAADRAQAAAARGRAAIDQVQSELLALATRERQGIQTGMADASAQVTMSRDLQAAAGAVCLLTILAVALLFIRPRIVAPLRAFREAVAQLARGEKVALPGVERGDEIGALARSMGEIYERGVEAARIRIALDNSSALMMIADADHRVCYVNSGLLRVLRENRAAIQEQLPSFDPDALIGASMDAFHKAPEHQRKAVDALRGAHQTRIRFGGRDFAVTVNPVVGEEGERLGSVVEWRDMTVELRIQGEIDQAVGAAAEGDFNRRVSLDEADGQLRAMAEKVNLLLTSVDAGVAAVSEAVEALSKGDLTHQMTGVHRGAFETLQRNVNASMGKLSEIVGAIHGAAHRISLRTDQMRDGANQLSARAESQASTLQETAATMEQITGATKESAESASTATSMASAALSGAERSGDIVTEAVEAMGQIENSAARISEIVNVIDSIAFQTNLLALNAAVEAARAGDAGKGFAVVASEVRALAQRAGDAAKDIRGLIEESGSHVATGVDRVRQTGDALTQIIRDVDSVTHKIREISSAADAQASGTAEISAAINSMDEMTQRNASMAEESASGATHLTEEAEKLLTFVAHFRAREMAAIEETPEEVAETAPPPAPAAPRAVSAAGMAAANDAWSEF